MSESGSLLSCTPARRVDTRQGARPRPNRPARRSWDWHADTDRHSARERYSNPQAHRPPARPGAAGNGPIAAVESLASPARLRRGYVVWPGWRAGAVGRVRAAGGIACLRTSSNPVRCACRSPCREAAPAAQRSGMPGG